MRVDAIAPKLGTNGKYSHPSPLRRDTFSRKREKDELARIWEVLIVFRRPDLQLRRARSMRRVPTKAEEIVWRSLRDSALGIKFRRQVPIGPYIADFACLAAKLVVELGGPPHDAPEQMARDRARDAWFGEHGWHVLRVPNEIVFGGGDMVLDRIKAALHEGPSSDLASRGHLLPLAGEGNAERV